MGLLEFISLIGIFLVMSRTQILVSCVALLLCVSLVRGDKAWWCDDGVNESKLSNSLQNFYLNTVPLSWHYTHNWGSEECPCEWFGVDCTGKNGTVSLHLENNGIEGSVASSFCDDIYSEINFSNNSLAGVLPECFGSMSKLQGLYLSDNEFQGLLPDALGQLSNLRRLEITRNRFAGPFPDYLKCPYFYFGDKVHIEMKNNSFWCPSPEWCQKNQCNYCISEPSDACTNQNKAACNAELECCKLFCSLLVGIRKFIGMQAINHRGTNLVTIILRRQEWNAKRRKSFLRVVILLTSLPRRMKATPFGGSSLLLY